MKLFSYLIVLAGFVGMCSKSNPPIDLYRRVIEHRLDGDQYELITVMDGISASEAKRLGFERAAEITVGRGDRYFTVDREEEIRVIRSEGDPFPSGNLYQELIIEGDFNRERFERAFPRVQEYPAIRLVFTPYATRPSFRAIDACTLTPCQ